MPDNQVITGDAVEIVHECDCDLEAGFYPNARYCECGIRWPALAQALHALVPLGGKRDLAYLGTALEMPPGDIRAAVAKAIMRSDPQGLALEDLHVVAVSRPARSAPLFHAVMILLHRVSPLTVGEAATRLGVTPEHLVEAADAPWLLVVGDGPLAERRFEPEGV